MKQFLRCYLPIFLSFVLHFGCKSTNTSTESKNSPPPPTHNGMCNLTDLGEAADAVEKQLPNNQYVTLSGMSSPKTLVWQDVKKQHIYYATKIMGAQGKLFYMDELQTGQKPTIKSTFVGTLMLWKHLPIDLLNSMKAQFKDHWGVEVDENTTYILTATQKPKGCK